ncbi:fibronectin type III domain-containing protein [Pelagicoccus sp. SDUM812002]|uniref:fibronectin type III domain-containing protein n=1 Tax=Pelagicoccus sp. SDUM812002 TaxID=3041266 RepID=UPI00280D996F|nr:fibronectin type III domain-containing protein [Pelagicoccus sp. SDUM812002]MDQ8185917.1 fibronectin type III domain-containing protein [Pelagicoccus sp. SDUM812002]
MYNITKLGFCVGSLALASVGYGSISFNIAAGTLRDQSGTAIDSGLVILAIDTDRDGFSLPDATNFLTGDDMEVARWDFSEGGGLDGEFLASKVIADYDEVNWEEGDPLALFWYPSLDKTATQPGAGAKFGVFADPSNESTGDTWTMPADNEHLYSLQFFAEGSLLSTSSFASQYVAAASLEEGATLEDLVDVMASPSKTTATSNTISWDLANSAQGYSIERRKVGTTDWLTVGAVAGNLNSYVDTNLGAGVTYEYRVVAENGLSAQASVSDEELFSERSLFRGVAIRSNIEVADPARHAYGGVILAAGNSSAATTKQLHMQASGNDTNNKSGDFDDAFLLDPTMNLYDQFAAAFTDYNDDWLGNDAAVVTEMDDLSAAGRGNVFDADADNRDAALLIDGAQAGNVGYSFIVSPYTAPGSGNPKSNYAGAPVDGEAVVSIYDAEDIDGTVDDIRISKLAARGHVSDSTFFGMIGGLDIEGNPGVRKQVLILGKGPHLETDEPQVAGLAISNPVLKLRLGGTLDVIAENDDWATATASTASEVTVETNVDKIRAALVASGNTLFDSHPKDSVMLVTLDPGTYTVEMVGMANGARESGLGFIEIQEIELDTL